MKKIHVLLSNALLIALLVSSTLNAQNKKHEFSKDRNISQSYNVSSGDKLVIKNQFGKVNIRTWSRNEVKVDIRIEVSSTHEEMVEDMFNEIDVNHGKDGSSVYFKTIFDKNKRRHENKNYKNQSNSINIDYEVSMPENLRLELENKFGKSTLPDLEGRVDVEQEFGDLEAGRLSQPGKITVKFGNAQIENVDGGSYDFQFVGDRAWIKNASGDIKVSVQHCKNSGVVLNAANVSSLNLKAQHSDVALVVPRDMSAQFTIDTNFGSFRNNSSFAIRKEGGDDEEKHGPRFNHTYKGSAGNGRTRVTLDGSFTDFYIGHEAPPMKAKKEKGDKNDKKVRDI